MQEILKDKKIRIALTVLLGVALVAIGLTIGEFFTKNAYQELLAATETSLSQEGAVAYESAQKGGQSVLAYYPTDSNGQAPDKLVQTMQAEMKMLNATNSPKQDTVYILTAKKTVGDNQVTFYQLYNDEYHYQGGKYEKVASQLYETLLQSAENEWPSLGDLLVNKQDAAILVNNVVEAINNEQMPTAVKTALTKAVTEESVLNLAYLYTDSQAGVAIPYNDQMVVVLMAKDRLVSLFKSQYILAKDASDLASAIAETKQRQVAYASENAKKLLDDIKNQPHLKQVALTFDDGPNPETTPKLLDVLKEKGVKATFFIVGRSVAGNEDILKRAVAEGHQLGNHSWDHPNLVTLSKEEAAKEINDTQDAIQKATGVTPHILRPPYGSINADIAAAVQLPVLQWDVDSKDWVSHKKDAIVSQVLNTVYDGSIVLIHDIYKDSIASVGPIIDKLKAEGYDFVTIDQMFNNGAYLQPLIEYFGARDARVIP